VEKRRRLSSATCASRSNERVDAHAGATPLDPAEVERVLDHLLAEKIEPWPSAC